MKHFDDFISLVNTNDISALARSNRVADHLANAESKSDFILSLLEASSQRTLNILRLYHDWISET